MPFASWGYYSHSSANGDCGSARSSASGQIKQKALTAFTGQEGGLEAGSASLTRRADWKTELRLRTGRIASAQEDFSFQKSWLNQYSTAYRTKESSAVTFPVMTCKHSSSPWDPVKQRVRCDTVFPLALGFQRETEQINIQHWEKPGGGGVFQDARLFWQQKKHFIQICIYMYAHICKIVA